MSNETFEDYDPFFPIKFDAEGELDTSISRVYSPDHSVSAMDQTHHAIYIAICNLCKSREGMIELDQEDYNDIPYRIDDLAWNMAYLISYMQNRGSRLPDEDIDLIAKRFKYLLRSVTRTHPYWNF